MSVHGFVGARAVSVRAAPNFTCEESRQLWYAEVFTESIHVMTAVTAAMCGWISIKEQMLMVTAASCHLSGLVKHVRTHILTEKRKTVLQ